MEEGEVVEPEATPTEEEPIPASPKGKSKLEEPKTKKKKKRKKGRHRRKRSPVEVEGERIQGLAYSSAFNPGQEDEEETSKQDDFILRKLFKKSGWSSLSCDGHVSVM